MTVPHFLVFETGGTKLVAGAAGPDGRLVETRVIARETNARAADSLEKICESAAGLRFDYEGRGASFQAIGFGFGGGVDRERRRPLPCLHEEGWRQIDIVSALESRFGLPAALENDCKTAALGEALFGAGAGVSSMLYVTLGTGVGGGLVRNGRIVELSPRGEVEIGHVHVLPDGPPCACGGVGCVEALASGPGLVGLAGWLAAKTRQRRRRRPTRRRSWRLGAAATPWRLGVVETAAAGLARGLAAAVNLLAPDRVIFGGGVQAETRTSCGVSRLRRDRSSAPISATTGTGV